MIISMFCGFCLYRYDWIVTLDHWQRVEKDHLQRNFGDCRATKRSTLFVLKASLVSFGTISIQIYMLESSVSQSSGYVQEGNTCIMQWFNWKCFLCCCQGFNPTTCWDVNKENVFLMLSRIYRPNPYWEVNWTESSTKSEKFSDISLKLSSCPKCFSQTIINISTIIWQS